MKKTLKDKTSFSTFSVNWCHKVRNCNHVYILKSMMEHQWILILHILGGPCTENRLSFRIVAGVWALAAFVFVQAYQSLLITYVIAPIKSPLINSAYDVADSTSVNLLIRRGGTIDSVLKVKIHISVNWECNFIIVYCTLC